MKKTINIRFLLTLATVGLLLPGCATRDANPDQARPNTGYVDLRAEPASELWWSVACFDNRGQNFKGVFSGSKPPSGGILRLAFAPGHYRLQVTFSNRVIAKPVEVEVEVQDGKITPVCIALTGAGAMQVETKTESFGGTARGRSGLRTQYSTAESTMYALSAEVNPPIAYRLKERMPYAR